MADKQHYMNEEVATQVPLYPTTDFDPNKAANEAPPVYENPRIDFSSGWKDRGFAIAFWIHFIIVTIVGLVLGIPALMNVFKDESFNDLKKLQNQFDMTPVFYGLGASVGVAIFASFVTFALLQCCSGSLILCSYTVIIALQSALILVIFLLIPFPISIGFAFIPILFLLFTLIYISCVRKRAAFADAHLKAGVAALNIHPSLVLIAFLMIVIQIIWFILWLLMVIGLQSLITDSPLVPNVGPDTPMNQTTTTAATIILRQSTRSTYSFSSSSSSSMNSSSRLLESLNRFKTVNSTSTGGNGSNNADGWINMIIKITLFFSLYWGMITFSNIAHFVSACSVGHWWFLGGDDQQYQLGTSVRRAFTTSFGTICFGSFFEALIKAVRSYAEDRRRKSILACLAGCILSVLEKIVGYMNEWGFIFAALTGQGYVQSSKSFIELFKNRGWTMVINDTLIGVTLGLINFIIGLISAFAGGIITYLLTQPSDERIIAIVIVSIISFLLGLFMSSVITTILTSCVRSVFVCFALNPAALGASHPDHLENLSKAWHKVYPNEFMTSGYAKYYQPPTV